MNLDWLSPIQHGKGIMTEAVAAVIENWAIPRMNVRKMIATAIVGNEGSLRVLEKNGFRLRDTLKELEEIKGKMKDIYVLDWVAKQ